MHCKQNGLERAWAVPGGRRTLWPRTSLPVINLDRIIDAAIGSYSVCLYRLNENAFILQINHYSKQLQNFFVQTVPLL